MYIQALYQINICIVYDKHNEIQVQDFRAHLQELDAQNKGYQINKVAIEGRSWPKAFSHEAEQFLYGADLVLLMMSERFITSTIFNSELLRKVLPMHEAGEIQLVPVLLTTCWWEDTYVGHLPVIPEARLPLYDASYQPNVLYEDLLEDLNRKILEVKAHKLENKAAFERIVEEAESIYKTWQQHPKRFRLALPMYEEALKRWKPGFTPVKEVLEQRRTIAQREIHFYHYAQAARQAMAEARYREAFLNSQDALRLRSDAEMEKLCATAQEALHEKALHKQRQPFEAHLKTGDTLMQHLRWGSAAAAYREALQFYHEKFEPQKAEIETKIAACVREQQLEEAQNRARDFLKQQQYKSAADTLLRALRQIHSPLFEQVDFCIKLIKDLEQVEPFQDTHSKRWGFFHKANDVVLIPAKYAAVQPFQENLAAVRKEKKWGYIDIEGKVVIPFEYNYAGHFHKGKARVIKGNTSFYISRTGKLIAAPE